MSWHGFTGILTQRGSLRGIARWLFLATIIVAPFLYGGTTAWSIEVVLGTLGIVLVLWLTSFALEGRWPRFPWLLLLGAGMVLAQGWWMVINAHSIYDASFAIFTPVRALVPALRGSTDYVLSLSWMLRATVLIGVIFLVTDLSRNPIWLLRLWYALAISGGCIALLGLVQKASRAEMIFWGPDDPYLPKTFFAAYLYHGNAGAALNLVLPAIAGLVCWLFLRGRNYFARAMLIAILVIVLLAIAANTSRMAQAVAGLLVIALAFLVARPVLRDSFRLETSKLLGAGLIVFLAAFAVAQTSHLNEPLVRWQQLAKQLPADQRWTANRAALRGLGDAGVFGLGPGVFRAVFPHYQEPLRGELHGRWRFLHDDYLQTVLEWGWLGTLTLGVLFFGGIGFGVRNWLKAKNWSTRQRIMLLCSLLALGGVAIHATVDFPLQILSLQLLVATYLGVCWGSGRWERSEVGGRRSEVGTDSQ
jgi:hypothetical protein